MSGQDGAMWAIVGADNFEIARCIAVAGLFSDRTRAWRAISDLKQSGFTSEQIGFVMEDVESDWSTEMRAGEHGVHQLGDLPSSLANLEVVKVGDASLNAGGTLVSA